MKKYLLWLSAFIAISVFACATTEPHPGHKAELKALMQNPKTAADHEAIAAHYEQEAQMYQEKEDEHKKLLSQYQREPWLLGKQAIGFQWHCERLIELESEAAKENEEMAKIHHVIADELKLQSSVK